MEAIIETQATGPLPLNSEPWKQNWNDTPTQTQETATKTVADPPATGSAPWERVWGSNSIPNAPRNVPMAPTSSKPVTGGDWDQINSKYAQGAAQRSQGQLDILQAELAKEKRPEFIASLKREISRVKGK